MGWRALVSVALAVGCAVGCADKGAEVEANARSVVPLSTADATAPIVDDARRFRLASPGPGWKLAAEVDASQLLPGAAAAALGPHGVTAVVLVRPASPAPLGEQVAGLIARLRLEQAAVEQNEATTIQGRPARQFVVKGEAGGVELRYAGLVLGSAGRLVQLLAWGSQSETTPDGAWFAPLREAFSLLDEPSGAQTLPPAEPDRAGEGWRVADGRFESIAGAVRLAPPAGFRLLVGRQLALVDPEAEVGLVQPALGLTVLVRSEPVARELWAGVAEGIALQLQQRWKLAAPPDRESIELAGQTGVLFRHADEQDVQAHGVACAEDRCIEAIVRHPRTAAREVEQAMAAAFRAVQVLGPTERAKLGKGGEQVQGADDFVGPDYALRGGTYQNFTARVAWTKPGGGWRVVAGPAAASAQREALLYVRQPALGLEAVVLVEQAAGKKLAAYHQAVIERMQALSGFAPASAEPTAVGDVEALASEGDAGPVGQRVRYRILTALDAGRAVQLLVWGRPANVVAHRDAVKAVAAGLRLQGVGPATERRGTVYRDARMGFELQPPAEWDEQDLAPPELQAGGSFVRWSRDGRWLAIVAVGVGEAEPQGDWFIALLEQLLRDQLGPLTRGAVARSRETLAGQPTEHVSWSAWLQQVDALLLRRGDVLFAVLTVDGDDAAASFARQRFVLLP